jgi:hypothetical protein
MDAGLRGHVGQRLVMRFHCFVPSYSCWSRALFRAFPLRQSLRTYRVRPRVSDFIRPGDRTRTSKKYKMDGHRSAKAGTFSSSIGGYPQIVLVETIDGARGVEPHPARHSVVT